MTAAKFYTEEKQKAIKNTVGQEYVTLIKPSWNDRLFTKNEGRHLSAAGDVMRQGLFNGYLIRQSAELTSKVKFIG